MKLLVACLLFLMPAIGWADLSADISQCTSREASFDIDGLSVEETEQAVLVAAKNDRSRCKSVEGALEHRAYLISRLSSAAEKVKSEIETLLSRSRGIVEKAKMEFQSQRALLKSIPNALTSENNRKLQEFRSRFDKSQADLMSTEQIWDSLFIPPSDGSFAILTAYSNDSSFEWDVKQRIQLYLERYPSFIQAKASAPRDGLVFLSRQAELNSMAYKIKNRSYIESERRADSQKLKREFESDAIKNVAADVVQELKRREGYRDLRWANAAIASGSCFLAHSVLSEQVQAMEVLQRMSDPRITDALNSRILPRIEERKQFMKTNQCDETRDKAKLQRGLSRLKLIILKSCKDSQDSLENIDAYLQSKDVLGLSIGAEVWNRAYFVALTCKESK